MSRMEPSAVYHLALEAMELEPQGIRHADVWTKRQAEIRAGARVTLRGALEETDDLDDAIRRHLRNEMSRCACAVPRECVSCVEREDLLVRLGYWAEENHEVIPVSEGPVEGTTTVLNAPAATAVEFQELRHLGRMTQARAAAALGVSQAQISKFESGVTPIGQALIDKFRAIATREDLIFRTAGDPPAAPRLVGVEGGLGDHGGSRS